tara:strand:- start:302 stop:490 length:189 start_codon:yes stop_codon:yes gene_type:complete
MNTYRVKSITDQIEVIEVKAKTAEEAGELVLSGDYVLDPAFKVVSETYENQEIISVEVKWKN